MNDKPLVSIIIPVYNGEKYLDECILHVINQTLKDIEIICVNDGSTDGSESILSKYEKLYQNIKVINQKNQGVIKARITGYLNSCGKYIGWVDCDDFIDKNMFEKLYDMAIRDDADVSICNYSFYPQNVINKNKWYMDYNGIKDWKFLSKSTLFWNKIVKKELLDKVNFESILNEFGEGCYSIVLLEANRIVTTSEELYHYRVGQSSLSSNFKNIKWFEDTIVRAQKKLDYCICQKYSQYYIDFFRYAYLYYNLLMMIVSSYNNNKKKFNDAKRIIKQEKLFSKKYKKYLMSNFSLFKYLFFKYIGINNYNIMKIACKIILK